MEVQPPSDPNDVAFNTFIGVLVAVCGNVSNQLLNPANNTMSSTHLQTLLSIGPYICCIKRTKKSSKLITIFYAYL